MSSFNFRIKIDGKALGEERNQSKIGIRVRNPSLQREGKQIFFRSLPQAPHEAHGEMNMGHPRKEKLESEYDRELFSHLAVFDVIRGFLSSLP